MKLLDYAHQYKSPNCGGSLKNPKFIVVHFTAGRSLAGSTQWLCSAAAKASAHLIIGREGTVNQLVPFDTIAWHAGESKWKGFTGLNKYSIGIELDNTGPVLKRADGAFISPTTGVVVEARDIVHADHVNGSCSWKYWTVYPTAQMRVLEDVSRELVAAFPTITECVGHDQIAPVRKVDPGPAMDMTYLNSVVFGRS